MSLYYLQFAQRNYVYTNLCIVEQFYGHLTQWRTTVLINSLVNSLKKRFAQTVRLLLKTINIVKSFYFRLLLLLLLFKILSVISSTSIQGLDYTYVDIYIPLELQGNVKYFNRNQINIICKLLLIFEKLKKNCCSNITILK